MKNNFLDQFVPSNDGMRRKMDYKIIIEEVEQAKDGFDLMFIAIENNICQGSFFDVFEYLIKDEEDYVKTFIDVYCSLDSRVSFESLCSERVIEKVKRINAGKMKDIDILRNSMDEEGNITIYRGQSKGSRSYRKSLSWTLDKNKADWFARRFDFSNSAVTYMAKVNIEDIIAYIDDRNEKEVLVEYEKLIKLKGNKRVRSLPVSPKIKS